MAAYARLLTERSDPRFARLDRLGASAIVRMMLEQERSVERALERAAGRIARAAEQIASAFRRGGRLFLVGAGTSGRLAVMEATECVPTFGTPPSMVQGIIAGGRRAMTRSIEGAEDDAGAGARALRRRRPAPADVVVGIAASGLTPFVRGALKEARRAGCRSVLISSNRTARCADLMIELPTGPEVVAGSTRLKAGSAAKLALNMLTVAAMVRIGKVYGNLMVDVRPNSRKLRARQVRIVSTLGRVGAARARAALRRCGGQVKTAIVMLRHGGSARRARARLAAAGGRLRDLIG
jgi:N-acetylmuramic acid 6-phosphate etherase